jgi:MSHA biogenesis protein MshP
MSSRGHQHGFGAIMAVVILVMLATLAAAVVRLSWSSQTESASDVNAARARQAAKAGVEWGLYQALRGSWTTCTSSTQTLDLRATTGMWVTVTCTSNATPYVEGGDDTGAARSVRIYTVDATACNGTATCPDNTAAAREGYVERRAHSSVSDASAQP